MQANHTPGPWSIGNIKATPLNPHALAVWPESVKVGEVASPVCIVSPIAELDDTDIQNARLIAAAPEMLREMELYLTLLNWIEQERPQWWAEATEGSGIATLNGYRTVIAKATKTGDLENY